MSEPIMMTDQKPFQFLAPGTLMIIGATGAGKTVAMLNILKHRNEIISPRPTVVYWVYEIYQPNIFSALKSVCPEIQFIQGFKQLLTIKFNPGNVNLIAMDDQMKSIAETPEAVDFFTIRVHHDNIFCIVNGQSLYYKSKHNSLLMRQAKYILYFQNKRNVFESNSLGRELGLSPKDMKELFRDASTYVRRPYLLFDCNPDTDEKRRILVNFLPQQNPKFFYYVADD